MPADGRRRIQAEWAEMEDRHHLTFETHEEGKLTLEEYLGRVVFYQERPFTRAQFRRLHVRPIETLSRDDRAGLATQDPARIEDRRGQQRIARGECASHSEVQARTSLSILLFPLASSTSASPTRKCFGLRWTSPRRRREQVVYIENTPMFVQIAEGLGIQSILHTDYKSTCAQAGFVRIAEMTKESSMKPVNPPRRAF